MNILVFNIETIPDIDGGQRIYNLQGLDDESTSKALFHLRKQQTASSILPLYLQRIATISVVYLGVSDDINNGTNDAVEHDVFIRSLGDKDSTEVELLTLFFKQIEQTTTTLVSWNGASFGLPVIHYRALKNNITAPNYWGKGIKSNTFQDNDSLQSYQNRHTDLMDVLSSDNKVAAIPLNDMALLLGFPGQQEMDASQIWDKYQQGKVGDIRNYSETAALNSYLIYLRIQFMKGQINAAEVAQECALLRRKLEQSGETHLQDFSRAWEQ